MQFIQVNESEGVVAVRHIAGVRKRGNRFEIQKASSEKWLTVHPEDATAEGCTTLGAFIGRFEDPEREIADTVSLIMAKLDGPLEGEDVDVEVTPKKKAAKKKAAKKAAR